MTKKSALIILDGWGHGLNPEVSAIAQANTPFVDSLYETYPNAELVTFGDQVGLPEGQMGNSEVGHLNIGAGRIVHQELARINNAISDGTLETNAVLQGGINYAINNKKPIHLLGLLSDGGVHSHINHLLALCDILDKYDGLKVYIHAFLDGRDTAPNGGVGYLQRLLDHIKGKNIELSSVIGRFYAMDRDNRWERIERAYKCIVNGDGIESDDIIATVKSQYDMGNTDEFMPAIQVMKGGNIEDGDAVLFYNYRTDRPRELTYALTQKTSTNYEMKKLNLHYMTMTAYDNTFTNIKVLFTKENIKMTIGEVISDAGLTQLRVAETEKYPHITFFMSGGRETPFEKEERIVVSSPKVPTYDLKPEMSAYEITEKLIHAVKETEPDFLCLNFANTDMVGHTGVFDAAVTATETVDTCLKTVVDLLKALKYEIFIIADHGNSDIMINPDGSPHTAHTTNMVPIIYISDEIHGVKLKDGKLADVAPTILSSMGIEIPEEMTGDNLIVKK